jgi:hypothetical protein
MESRRWIATIVALFALVALSLGSRDAHAVDAKYLCNCGLIQPGSCNNAL